jgi:predicted nucleic acid-binding protein
MTLIDANVLIDLFTDDTDWAGWSARALTDCAAMGLVGINPTIFAEASVAFCTESAFESALTPLGLQRWELPYAAGFQAGKAFFSYRRQGGEKLSPLPDFYIGAHAEVKGLRLLTRDPRRYRQYFPKVRLVCPGDPAPAG